MEFSVKECGGLINALNEANDEINGNPKENIVILDMDCDGNSNTVHTFKYIRIKGAAGVKNTIKNYGFQCKGDIYLKDINVETNVDAGPDTFIRWNYATDSGYNGIPNSSVYIDRVNVKGYRRFVMEPQPQPGVDSVKSLSKIRMKNCTFRNCYGSMLALYSRCDDAKVYGNTYTEPYIPDNIEYIVDQNLQDSYVHTLVTLGSSSQSGGTYYRYPINNVEVFDNVMIGTYKKGVEDSIENIYHFKKVTVNNNGQLEEVEIGSENHLCCLHGNNLNVHDNLYRGWVMITPAQKVGPEPIMIKGSDVKITGNVIEDCTIGEGAITFKGSYGDIEIANNRINPGYETKQKSSGYGLIQLQSLGGVDLKEYQKPTQINVKINSNHIIFKRLKNDNPNCKAAIYFNSIGADQYDPFVDIECCDNYYEGIGNFVRCSQRSRDVNLLVDNNTVITTGSLPWLNANECKQSSDCTTALVMTGVKNFDNNLNVKILKNRGSVGVVYVNDCDKDPIINEQMKTNVYIAENAMSTKLIFLSTPPTSAGVVTDNNKNISIYVVDNHFNFLINNDAGYIKAHGNGTIRSSNADIVINGNRFDFSSNYEPYSAFASNHQYISKYYRVIKCRSIEVMNNVFKTSKATEYSNTQFVCRGYREETDAEKYFIYYLNESEDDTHVDVGNEIQS